MDWETIIMIIIAALLLLVWLPALIISVRRSLRKKPRFEINKNITYHEET